MCRSGMKLPVSTLAGIAILLAVTGCADFRLPRIDPSGEHLFIYDSPPPAAVPCPPGTVPTPVPAAPAAVAPAPIPAAVARPPVAALPRVSPYSDVAAMLSPFRTVAPVGSQVVMLGGVRGGDGYLRTNRRLEWWLMPGSVGQFTGIGENSFADFLVGDFTRPRLISATSAVGSTTRVAQRAGGPGNSVYVARGQGWVTVSSPVEGVSHVTRRRSRRGPSRRTCQVGDDLLDRCPIWLPHPGHRSRRHEAIADHDRLAAKQSLPSPGLDRAV